MEASGTSICLVMKAVILSARWAGRTRRLGLEQAAKAVGDGAESEAENVLSSLEMLSGHSWGSLAGPEGAVPTRSVRSHGPSTHAHGPRTKTEECHPGQGKVRLIWGIPHERG